MYNSESLESPSSPKSPPLLTMTNNVEGSMEVEQVGSPPSGGGAMANSSTSDEGRQKRRKCLTPKECSCPVCGVTLRPREISTHFAQEVDKLVRLPQSRPLSQRTPILPATSPISVDLSLPSTSSSASSEPSNCTSKRKERSHRKGTDWPKYERIRANRQARTRQKRGRGEADEGTEGRGTGERECPVCDKPFPISEVQRHTARCLRQAETEFEDDEVDVEGDDGDEDGDYEEYEWCGVTRVRATSLLREGQLHAIGTKVKRGSEDEMVDVCDDDDNNFGPSQYRDEDLNNRNNSHHWEDDEDDDIPPHASTSTSPHAFSFCTSDTCGEHSSNMVSRVMSAGAVQHNNATFSSSVDFGYGHSSSKGSSAANDDGISPTSSTTQNLSSNAHNKSSTLSAVVGNDPLLSSINDGDGPEGDVWGSLSAYSVGGGGGPVVEALRARVRQLEEDRHRGPYTCRVCHGEYEKPVVSVSCWHVHCETCWLQSLAAKKLCPQCSAITTATDLRRVYL